MNSLLMPNFLIIGTAKAGTTALSHYLQQHPDIYMSSKKELNFFTFDGEHLDNGVFDPGGLKRYEKLREISVTKLDSYQYSFRGATAQKAVGEASPMYLYNPRTPQRIYDYKPNMRLIAILRNPADRAHSHFLQYAFKGQEPIADFTQAIKAEDVDVPDIWWGYRHYVRLGFYYRQLQPYFDLFPPHLIKVFLFEDFQTNPQGLLQDIFDFLGVDNSFVADTAIKHNQSLVVKHQTIHRFLGSLNTFLRSGNPVNNTLRAVLPKELKKLGSQWRVKQMQKNVIKGKPHLSTAARGQLISIYQDDILKLQELIGRDLSSWLTQKDVVESPKSLVATSV